MMMMMMMCECYLELRLYVNCLLLDSKLCYKTDWYHIILLSRSLINKFLSVDS
jgi:hypothetical protein